MPVFHLRVHQPVRFTPQGSPLLLVTVINHTIARRLIADGLLGAEENNFEFHRLITERVSREVCTIRASTEELELFNYVLRVNSTKMRRGAWQSKNLPRGETSPWMPTFVSPLYVENLRNICDNIVAHTDVLGFNLLRSALQTRLAEVNSNKSDEFPICCAACFIKKIDMRKCSGCKIVSYCSVACQKSHWPKHKEACSFTKFARQMNQD